MTPQANRPGSPGRRGRGPTSRVAGGRSAEVDDVAGGDGPDACARRDEEATRLVDVERRCPRRSRRRARRGPPGRSSRSVAPVLRSDDGLKARRSVASTAFAGSRGPEQAARRAASRSIGSPATRFKRRAAARRSRRAPGPRVRRRPARGQFTLIPMPTTTPPPGSLADARRPVAAPAAPRPTCRPPSARPRRRRPGTGALTTRSFGHFSGSSTPAASRHRLAQRGEATAQAARCSCSALRAGRSSIEHEHRGTGRRFPAPAEPPPAGALALGDDGVALRDLVRRPVRCAPRSTR